MIKVIRGSYIPDTTPEEVFIALSDPNALSKLIPRIQKVELKDRRENSARLITYMSIGGIFGSVRCEGTLDWVDSREIVFKVQNPLFIENHWVLSPAVNGTDLQATMKMDLTPLLGPMAQFVPTEMVTDTVAKEFDQTLRAVTDRCAALPRVRQAAAA